MKLDKITIDGKKDTIEVLDKVFGSKINKQLVSNVLYKQTQIIKVVAKQSKKMKSLDQLQKFMLKKVHREMHVMQVEKHLFL